MKTWDMGSTNPIRSDKKIPKNQEKKTEAKGMTKKGIVQHETEYQNTYDLS